MTAQGSRTGLGIVAEVTRGTTPVTPAIIDLPYKSHSLDLTKEAIESEDIYSDRVPRHFRHGNRSGGGAIEVDLRRGSYDALLESALMGAWTTNVLKTGIVPKAFSIEDAARDINEYRMFRGMVVNQLTVRMAPNQMVSATFDMVGTDVAPATSVSADASWTADPGYEPFDAYSGAILEGGSAAGIVTSLEFTVNNDVENIFGIGSAAAQGLDYGMARVTGTVTLRYQNETIINKFLNEVTSSIQVTVNDPTAANPYVFLFPSVKYSGASVPVSNPKGRMVTLPFVSLYNVAENTNLKITRTSV